MGIHSVVSLLFPDGNSFDILLSIPRWESIIFSPFCYQMVGGDKLASNSRLLPLFLLYNWSSACKSWFSPFLWILRPLRVIMFTFIGCNCIIIEAAPCWNNYLGLPTKMICYFSFCSQWDIPGGVFLWLTMGRMQLSFIL